MTKYFRILWQFAIKREGFDMEPVHFLGVKRHAETTFAERRVHPAQVDAFYNKHGLEFWANSRLFFRRVSRWFGHGERADNSVCLLPGQPVSDMIKR